MDNRGHSFHRKTAATLRHEISQHIKSWDPANQSWQGPECDFCRDLAISWGTEACTACQTAPVHVTMAFIPERGLRVTRVSFVFSLPHSQCKRGSFNQPQTLFERLKCNIRWPWNTSLPSAYPSFFSSTAWPIQGLLQTRSHCITPGLLNPHIVQAPPAAIALPTKPSTVTWGRMPEEPPMKGCGAAGRPGSCPMHGASRLASACSLRASQPTLRGDEDAGISDGTACISNGAAQTWTLQPLCLPL